MRRRYKIDNYDENEIDVCESVHLKKQVFRKEIPFRVFRGGDLVGRQFLLDFGGGGEAGIEVAGFKRPRW